MEGLQDYRKSHVEYGIPYFWTATINNWNYLLLNDSMKMEVIQSLQWLTQRNLISIYAYVIMPNHIHLIWTVKDKNGKESPQGSLLKFTAHRFKKILFQSQPDILRMYEVNASNKTYEFWQRDSLALPVYSRPFLLEKIVYIHNNPVAKHWRLATEPATYRFSSASFFENGIDEFGILSPITELW